LYSGEKKVADVDDISNLESVLLTKMDKHNPSGTGIFTLDEKVTF
jgi:hypothetical protein